jgi:hypothetical protein
VHTSYLPIVSSHHFIVACVCIYPTFAGQFTNDKKAVPSWSKLSEDLNYEYVDADSLPGDVVLRDPSKTREQDLKSIWELWIARQTENSQGLVFLKSFAQPSQPRQSRQQKEVPTPDSVARPEEQPSPPHPNSPAAHAMSSASKLSFLRSLSSEKVYNKFVDLLSSREAVSLRCFFL